MRVTFLGTGGAVPTTERGPSAFFIERDGERLLFDCGEGTQRQMMRFGTGFNLSHIFVTHLHGDHILGIPGLIQTLDFNDRTDALAIHGPPGSKPHLQHLVETAGYRPGYPINIREIRPGTVAVDTGDYMIRSFETSHRGVTSIGYALIESDRKGRFNRERAEELGVPIGPKFGQLHDGESVELADGSVVHPKQVVGDPRPGRRVVYTGDTRPTEMTVEAATDADLLIHDATFAADRADRARQTGHSTAQEAAQIAARADVRRLALTHISSRYTGDVTPLKNDATAALDGQQAFIPNDGRTVDVPFPDADDAHASPDMT
ncbi:ribonuclease Z [Haloquadratum walsbyi]|jgi:RNAse Z (EC 3.1.26.11)|nr:ribonuclease Z [Haloquadratum walsbyi]